MNAKQAKRLRRMARELGRPAEHHLAPVGPPRRDGLTGRPIRRPLALTDSTRRAYQEAKKIFREEARAGR